MSDQAIAPSADLQQIVAEADLGGREPAGAVGRVLAVVAAAWSLFQLWVASPLPFALQLGIFNDSEARSIHLAFAVFLAFVAYPAWRRSSRTEVPPVLAVCTNRKLYFSDSSISAPPRTGIGMAPWSVRTRRERKALKVEFSDRLV